MSDDKPINSMYGSKIKLNLNKIKDSSKDDVVEDSKDVTLNNDVVVEDNVPDVPVEDEVVVDSVVEDNAPDVPVEDEVVVDSVDGDDVVDVPVEDEVVVDSVDGDDVVDETNIKTDSNEFKTNLDSNQNKDYKILMDLKSKLKERENKLNNQSGELNYLTNKVIPKLKKENSELKKLKNELTIALENSTKKYFNQLDINADLSDRVGKLGADGAVNKIKLDKLESEMESIKDKYESKIGQYKSKIDSLSLNRLDSLKENNIKLNKEIKSLELEISNHIEENKKLNSEVHDLRNKLIDVGSYKDDVDKKTNKKITDLENEINSLKTQLKVKESSYDKLSNESQKTISNLRKQVNKLEKIIDKQSNRGFDRISNKSVKLDD